ncbi:MAG: NADH:flavin oxidoreductase [Anaerolineaceae bacterium]|nr:NADH:flavin oxidoreductase [Anaerolineaceae bacterium]
MYEKLFEPIKIGPVTIKNRIAMAPMNQQGDRDCHVTLQYMSFFNARALGGFGLLTTGSIITNKEGREEYPFVPYLYPGSFNMGYWADFTEGIHSQGTDTKIFAQLSPGFGRQTGRTNARTASAVPFKREDLYDGLLKAKSTRAWAKYWRNDWTNHLLGVPRPMTVDEIHDAQKSYIRASEMAILAGFDGIEIHGPHGYGLHQFLSPRTNKRTDEYGGSVENRCRYISELLVMLRKDFGNSVPVCVRMSGREYQPGGIQPEDVRKAAQIFESSGADAISLSNGSGYDDFSHFFPDDKDNKELLEAQGKKLKDIIKIPVISAGFSTPAGSENAIRNGQTDLVALGRQAMADPDWPNKVKEGRVDEIMYCSRDNYCVAMGIWGGTVSQRCTVNPNYGKEQYMPQYWPKPMKGKLPDTLKRWKPGDRWQSQDPWASYFKNK